MKFFKLLIAAVLASTSIQAINLSVALVRNGQVTHMPAIAIELGQSPSFLYQDDSTYIEAELISDNVKESVFQLTIATKNENNYLQVRGLPKITLSYSNGLGMSSMHCQGMKDIFLLVLAASR